MVSSHLLLISLKGIDSKSIEIPTFKSILKRFAMQCKGILTRAGRNAVNKLPGSGSYIITATISGTTLAPTHSISPGFGGRRGRRDHSPDLSSQNQPRTHHLQTTMIRKRLAGHSLRSLKRGHLTRYASSSLSLSVL